MWRSEPEASDDLGLAAVDRGGQPQQQHDRDVALAGLDLGDVALGNPGAAGPPPAPHLPPRARGASRAAPRRPAPRRWTRPAATTPRQYPPPPTPASTPPPAP